MDFDLDDALDSDDSFFEDPKALSKRTSLTKTPEKKSLDSLFGLADKSSNDNVGKTDPKPKQTVKFEDAPAKPETNPIISKKPKDDWLLDTPAQKSAKKTDFLEDILSIKPKTAKIEKKVTSLEDILKESKLSSAPKVSTSLKEINTATEAPSDFGLLSSGASRRRGRRGSGTGVEDNLGLGLFTDEYQSGDFFRKDKKLAVAKTEDVQNKTKIVSDTGMPDWLGGTTFTEKIERKSSESAQQETKSVPSESEKLIEKVPTKIIESTSSVAVDDFASGVLKPHQINQELQNTFASLHQQESLLLVSLQFKKYEEALKDIKNQQQEILVKQEKQFNTLIDEYILKQQMVENNIRLQQERINNQIQMLLSNPLTSQNERMQQSKDDVDHGEKSEVLEIVDKMKQRHNEEMFMMEESYKKQIDLAEKSASAMEEKLQNELKIMSEMFDEKLKVLKSKHEEEFAHGKEKMKALEEQHNDEIKSFKENRSRIVEEMKMDHETQIIYIKEMKQREHDVLSNGNMFAEKIDSGIEMLTNSTRTLQEIEEKVFRTNDVLLIAREKSIESKEKEIILMRNALQKCRDSAENERAQLLALVRNLEIKLAEQSANAQEDRWALQQASATLTARATALEREAEYNRNSIEREREQVKTLKESLLAEQEKIIQQLTEEKLQISAQKSRIETSSKLSVNFEAEKMKREAETAIQVTKELTEKVSQERESLYRQKTELESLRRILTEKERELAEKEADLDFLTRDTNGKLKENQKVLAEAKRMENIYKERLQELQNQWVSISSREKKLAEEKIQLSKERLALYTCMKTSKSCVLCKPDGVSLRESSPLLNVQEDVLHTKDSDASALRIRFEAMDDGESEVSKEDSHSANAALM
ncbi:hypothetical protein JTB14_005829 [Gonioctena quinquepunctata]|nr:hypothetical protein JTB14_005829 [Gonioctena quinquepunctata]